MPASRLQILIAMGAYLLFFIGVRVWYAKKSNIGTEKYFLGGRGLGHWVADDDHALLQDILRHGPKVTRRRSPVPIKEDAMFALHSGHILRKNLDVGRVSLEPDWRAYGHHFILGHVLVSDLFYGGNIKGDYRFHAPVYGAGNLGSVSCYGIIDYNAFKGSFFAGLLSYGGASARPV